MLHSIISWVLHFLTLDELDYATVESALFFTRVRSVCKALVLKHPTPDDPERVTHILGFTFMTLESGYMYQNLGILSLGKKIPNYINYSKKNK